MSRKYKNNAEKEEAYREVIESAQKWAESWDERHPKMSIEVREYVREIQRQVAQEIGHVETFATIGWPMEKYAKAFPLGSHPAEETVALVALVLFAFKKGTSVWVRNFSGDIKVAGGYFPDVIGEQIVSDTHKYGLEKSPTYSALYRELLSILDQRFGNNYDIHDRVLDASATAVKQELARTYSLVEPHASL